MRLNDNRIACDLSADATPSHVEDAHKQVQQALQTADHHMEALKARVNKKSAQLSEVRLQLGSLRQDLEDMGGQRRAPPSLPDTESSDQAGLALNTLCICSCTHCVINTSPTLQYSAPFAQRCMLLKHCLPVSAVCHQVCFPSQAFVSICSALYIFSSVCCHLDCRSAQQLLVNIKCC